MNRKPSAAFSATVALFTLSAAADPLPPNLVLGTKLTTDEKQALVAYMLTL